MSLIKAQKILSRFISNYDLFGSRINLTIKNQTQYSTKFTMLVSLFVYGFSVFTFLSIFLDMIDGRDPNIVSSIQYTENPEIITIKEDSYLFAVSLVDERARTIFQQQNYTFFLPSIFLCTRTTSSSGMQNKCLQFQLKLCNQIQLNEKLSKVIKLNEKGLYKYIAYCADRQFWENQIQLVGFSQSEVFETVTIDLKKCINNTIDNIVCAPREVIDEQLSNGFIGVLFSDRMLNQQKKGNPYQIYGKTITTTFSSQIYKQVQVYLRHSYTETFENFYYFFGAQQTTYHELQFERMDEYTSPTKDNDLARIIFQLDDKKVIYYRTYNNILNILGDIGGLLSLFIFAFNFVMAPISKTILDIQLSNKIFNFNFPPQKRKQSQILPQKYEFEDEEFRKQSQTVLSKIFNLENYSQLEKNDLAVLKKLQKNKINYQNFKVFDYLKFAITKKDIMDQMLDQIYQKLDVAYLIQKLIEIDQLKILLLSPDQQKIFHCLSKTVINFDGNTSTKTNIIEQIQQNFQAYKSINLNSENQVNKRLLHLMDEKMKRIFDDALNQSIQPQKKLDNIMLSPKSEFQRESFNVLEYEEQ